MNSIVFKIVFFILITFPSFHALTKEQLIWRVIDWPPFYILHGDDKGQGIYDQLISSMINYLPEYEHQRIIMNTRRALTEIQHGKNVCHPSALANTDALLSNINSFLLPYRIIYTVDNTTANAVIRQQKSVSLVNLLANKELTVGASIGRYSSEINTLFEKYAQQDKLVKNNNYDGLIQMLLTGRIDFLVEYPPIITYSKKSHGSTALTNSMAITELGDNNFLAVYFACPNNDWGKKVIAQINIALLKESQNNNYLENRLKWYDDESKKILKSHYQSHYLLDKTF